MAEMSESPPIEIHPLAASNRAVPWDETDADDERSKHWREPEHFAMTLSEVAAELGITKSSVATHQARGLAKLRRLCRASATPCP